MDEITDNVGGLNLTAKEWRPGQGFAPPRSSSAPSATMEARRQTSAGSESGSIGAWKNETTAATGGRATSWGGEALSFAI